MRVGTRGFVAERLVEAREARGLAQTALSELTGIKSQSISHYEQGRQSPSPEALSLLCEKLEIPERYFLNPLPPPGSTDIFFRNARPPARVARMQTERRLGWLKEIAAYLRRHIDMPLPALPHFPADLAAPADEPERIAEQCRAHFGLGNGPVSNLVSLLENAGCIVSQGVVQGEAEGTCSHQDDHSPCILLAEEPCGSRLRFDLAHELAHLVMHRSFAPTFCADSEAHRVLEHQADRFARAFLLPAGTFGREVWAHTVDALATLKKEWNCPVTAMIARCGELGIFDADEVRRAQANLARRGRRAGEPQEFVHAAERPALLARCMRLLIDAGVKDRHSLITDLSLNPRDIEQLTGLPPRYLSRAELQQPSVLRLRDQPLAPENVA